MIDLHRVDFAPTTEKVRLDIFVAHDAAGDKRHTPASGLSVKASSALWTSDHAAFPFGPHHRLPKSPGSFECRFDPARKVHEGEPFPEWRMTITLRTNSESPMSIGHQPEKEKNDASDKSHTRQDDADYVSDAAGKVGLHEHDSMLRIS